MSGSSSETRGRFCEGLGGCMMVQYSVGPMITFMAGLLQGSMWIGCVIRLFPWSRRHFWTTMQFSMKTMLPFTQLVLFNHGLKSTKISFNIFPGQASTITRFEHGQFWKFHLQYLWSNLVFKNSTRTCSKLVKVHSNYLIVLNAKVIQHNTNKRNVYSICNVSIILSNPCTRSLPPLHLCELEGQMTHGVNSTSCWYVNLFHSVLYWIIAQCCHATNLNHNELVVKPLLKLGIHFVTFG
jgi:hypothetical protein